jgi:hypothetical protein
MWRSVTIMTLRHFRSGGFLKSIATSGQTGGHIDGCVPLGSELDSRFSSVKLASQRHTLQPRFIGYDQKYRLVENSEILSWLREATGMTKGKGVEPMARRIASSFARLRLASNRLKTCSHCERI